MPPRKKDKPKVNGKSIESWKCQLDVRRQNWNDHLFHLREQAFNVGAPTTFDEKVQRVIEIGGGEKKLMISPPSHLSFNDTLCKHPRKTLDFAGLRISEWFQVLASRTIPPGLPIKPSVCVNLSLKGSDINDGAMKHIVQMKNIQILDISGCEILTDVSLHLIRRTLNQLCVLHIDDCRNFSAGVISSTWTDCTRLHSLYATGCQGITDRVLNCIATTKRSPENQAQAIDVRKCRHVTDSGISDIANCKHGMKLSYFAFGNCLQVQAMAFFAFETSISVTALHTLDVTALNIDETSVSWLTTGCPNLVKLNLSNCLKLNDFCCLLLSRCQSLRWLCLKGCEHITSTGIKNLLTNNSDSRDDMMSALEYLNLKNCVKLDDSALATISQACLDLVEINLRGLPHITDIGVTAIAKYCTILRKLKLSGCRNHVFYGRPNVGDTSLLALAKLCRHLRVLDLAGCPRLTSNGVAAIANQCHELTHLYINDTSVDDNAILALASQCSRIQHLQLSKCHNLSDLSIEYISHGLFEMKHLELAYCTQLTDAAMIKLGAAKLQLQFIDFTGNEKITDVGLMALCRGCRQLREVLLKGCDRLTEGAIVQAAAMLPFGSIPCTTDRIQHIGCAPTQWIKLLGHLIDQYDGAVRLQASFRKWKKRDATLQAMTKQKLKRERRAVVKIQRCFRRHREWLNYMHMLTLGRNLSVITHIQAIYRGNKSRIVTRRWRALAYRSATIIQCGVKHHLYRRHSYARKIQRVYRGHRGRVCAHQRLVEKRKLAAEKLVAWYRRCVARYQFHKRSLEISVKVRHIQRAYRNYFRGKKFRALAMQYIQCAINIQSVARMMFARHAVKSRRVVFNSSAKRIQSVYRGYRIRRWYRKFKACVFRATIQIQAWFRAQTQRYKYLCIRSSIIATQRRYRTYITVRDMRLLVSRALEFRRLEATKLIQRVWRGYKGRRRALLFRKIQRAKYARKGQNSMEYLLRRRLLRRGAAIIIQKWFRPIRMRYRMVPIHKWRVDQAKLCIQRYVKGWLARVRTAREKARILGAVQDIQRLFRGHVGRTIARAILLAKRRLHSAIIVQRIIRGYLARCYCRRYIRESTKAALFIQRVYRGKLGRRIAAIERAKRTLAARDKYKASIKGMLDLKLDLRERKFYLQRQIELMKVSHKQLQRRRIGYEKKMIDIRKQCAMAWSRANEVVHESYKLNRNLVGASENVYYTKIELDQEIERRTKLTEELNQVEFSISTFKKALHDKIQQVRMMDPEEFWDIAKQTGIFDGVPSTVAS